MQQKIILGLKISISVVYKEFQITYEVTSASIHDVNMAYVLVELASNKQTLTDKGYVGTDLKQLGHTIDVDLWMPPKKSQ